MSATFPALLATKDAGAAKETLDHWSRDPVAFVRECFGAEPDAWQAEALAAFPHTNRLALKACKNPGKTCLLAWLVWNFLLTRPAPKIACTSITEDNLSDGLWSELAKWQGKSKILQTMFVWTKTRIVCRERPETWFAAARTWSRTADATRQAETLAGFHGDYVLFVLDESGSTPQAVMTTAEAVLGSGIESKVVQAGNATSLEGPLHRAVVEERHLWTTIEVTGDPDDPKRSPRVDRAWAQQQIDTYGRDNPWVLVNVFGRFPPASLNSLLGPEEVQAAMQREVPEAAYKWAQMRIGLDVARYGDDRTCLFPRQGLRAFQPLVLRHARDSAVSTDIATVVLAKQKELHAEVTIVDATGGWAAGACDVLKASRRAPINVQFHAPATQPDRYRNRRAEIWFEMAEWIRRGAALPNVPELLGELTSPTYTFLNGKFQLEAKDQVKARLGRSPDLADALALTFGLPEQAPKKVAPAAPGRREPFTSRAPVPGGHEGLGWMG